MVYDKYLAIEHRGWFKMHLHLYQNGDGRLWLSALNRLMKASDAIARTFSASKWSILPWTCSSHPAAAASGVILCSGNIIGKCKPLNTNSFKRLVHERQSCGHSPIHTQDVAQSCKSRRNVIKMIVFLKRSFSRKRMLTIASRPLFLYANEWFCLGLNFLLNFRWSLITKSLEVWASDVVLPVCCRKCISSVCATAIRYTTIRIAIRLVFGFGASQCGR